MKPRLVLACLMPLDVNIRARQEFDALIVDGKNDMTGNEVAEAVGETSTRTRSCSRTRFP